MTKPSVVFFGSGPVAAKSLSLLQKHCDVEAIITKPSTLEEMRAVSNTDKVYSVGSKQELDDLIENQNFRSQLGVLIDFGIIVSTKVIEHFSKGILNSHFSLLPEWRGADPITFSILSGQSKTGVSLMLIDEGMDTGSIIRQESLVIAPDDTITTLTDRLINLSDEMLRSDIPLYLTGSLKPREQPHTHRATYSRKLTKEDSILDFNKPADVLEREIRAFAQWPKSRTKLADIDVIITSAEVIDYRGIPGDLEVKGKQLVIYCADKALLVKTLKPAGKNSMPVEAFIAGYGSRLNK